MLQRVATLSENVALCVRALTVQRRIQEDFLIGGSQGFPENVK